MHRTGYHYLLAGLVSKLLAYNNVLVQLFSTISYMKPAT